MLDGNYPPAPPSRKGKIVTLSLKIASAIAVGILAVAGCGSEDSGTAVQDSPAATTSPAAPTTKSGGATRTSTTEAATGDSVERAVDKTGWYGGFKITVDDVTATPEGGTTTVDLELSYENLVGVKNTAPDTGYLEVDGGEVVEVTFGNPDIAGFGKGTGTATASLKRTDESADLEETLDSLVLVYGEPDSNTTRLPFAADAAVESLEPRGIPVGQTFSDKVQIELSKAFLWPSYQAGEQNKYELWTELSLTCTEECARFGYGVTIANFTLTAPNGKSIKADDRSPWATSSMSDISPVDHQWLVFVIDEPATGNYTFNLTMKAMSNQPEYAVDATTTIAL